jgi:hypothetical protein
MREGKRRTLFFLFTFVDAFFDLANLLGDRDLLGADSRTFPQSLATPGSILMIQEGNPLFRGFIP